MSERLEVAGELLITAIIIMMIWVVIMRPEKLRVLSLPATLAVALAAFYAVLKLVANFLTPSWLPWRVDGLNLHLPDFLFHASGENPQALLDSLYACELEPDDEDSLGDAFRQGIAGEYSCNRVIAWLVIFHGTHYSVTSNPEVRTLPSAVCRHSGEPA